ncbi:MAG TPA: hydroxymethylbilane synthase [Bacillota bacterium]|jgi:uroporphyrinogen III methyltransferase/synthase
MGGVHGLPAVVRVGSRESALAIKQTEWVVARLQGRHPGLRCEIVGIKTKGDRILDVSLSKIGGRGLFTKEIEAALVEGRIDLAVHSLKDMPTVLPAGLVIAAVTEREDPRDVLVGRRGLTLATLPRSAKVGTSSLRRAAQLKHYRPDLQIVPIRGNLATRLRKMDEEGLDAIVLAAAGLRRLGLDDQITDYLPESVCLPAVGQGALAIEAREGDRVVADIVGPLNDAATAASVAAERGFLRRLGGGCQVPIGALGQYSDGRVHLAGVVADPEGVEAVRGELEGPADEAEAIGAKLAGELLANGARGILARVEAAAPAEVVASENEPPSEPPAMAGARSEASGSPGAGHGRVFLIGAGPGDPGLLTIKGRDCLARADVVVYDRLVNPRLLAHCRPDAELIYVGKGPDRHTMRQDEINQVLVEKAAAGLTVARLKGGDPFVFGRGGEEAEALLEHGLPFEVIPGVTSAVAAPAYAGIPVTHRDFTSSVTIVTGHEDPEKEATNIDWASLGAGTGTLIFLMGTRNLPLIAQNLAANGRPPETPTAVIHWGTFPRQRTVVAPLKDIAHQADLAGITNPAVVLVGRVAGLRERLAWFENRPLFGRRVLTTRTRVQAGDLTEALTDLGAEVVEYPLIAIVPPTDYQPLDRAIAAVEGGLFDWLVFTSQNGVDGFFARLAETGRDVRLLHQVRLCAVGPATGEALSRRSLVVDLIPPEFNADGVLAALLETTVEGQRVLVVRAEEGREVLIDGLIRAGREVVAAAAYRNVPAGSAPGTLPRWLEPLPDLLRHDPPDLVTFSSSSTVKNFIALLPPRDLMALMSGIAVACIGPQTAQTAAAFGLRVDAMPPRSTIPDLVKAVLEYFRRAGPAAAASPAGTPRSTSAPRKE